MELEGSIEATKKAHLLIEQAGLGVRERRTERRDRGRQDRAREREEERERMQHLEQEATRD